MSSGTNTNETEPPLPARRRRLFTDFSSVAGIHNSCIHTRHVRARVCICSRRLTCQSAAHLPPRTSTPLDRRAMNIRWAPPPPGSPSPWVAQSQSSLHAPWREDPEHAERIVNPQLRGCCGFFSHPTPQSRHFDSSATEKTSQRSQKASENAALKILMLTFLTWEGRLWKVPNFKIFHFSCFIDKQQLHTGGFWVNGAKIHIVWKVKKSLSPPYDLYRWFFFLMMWLPFVW